ncbi:MULTISPECIES: phasin family protein [unclassified Variovorax]|mgnify:CR=1 FL=1|jgi:poly(hydroxyalkanoate) granule-associated protein|uniref:phasin family protein n=1 Tax=unclassified Variovorax TaxID=663243 RepID=UPI000F7D7C52|nr:MULTISPECIES: phasin family protein [unclassified Variovorax]RSZ42444.1 poly(hydroxyalkanoate) granule-associated protein [Variovorax sp. 553]RSZ43418.1 poly(hydroxyalkanoate) granule-associated protein [Variovorax sp. 679]
MATQDDDSNGKAADRIKDSAQQIWLAGLGAFAKMQQEGSKAFEALVKDGAGMQKKTQQAAEETLAQAQQRMAGFASEFGTKAAGQWGKLENIFEERVARAMEKLGAPSAADMAALQARVEALEAQLKKSQGAAAPRKTAARKTAAAPAAKKTLRRSKAS